MNQANILIIEHTPQDSALLTNILQQQNYSVRCVIHGENAIEVAQSGWADLILLDTKFTDLNSHEFCQQIKNNAQIQETPLIFIADFDPSLSSMVFQAGGSDYVLKPLHKEELLTKVATQIRDRQTKSKIHQLELINQELSVEIEQRQETQDKLLKLALHDSVTGLPNRNSFLGTLGNLIPKYKQQKEYQFAILLIDFNLIFNKKERLSFKILKSHLNHLAINKVLKNIAERLQKCLPNSATLSRFESNEFAILLEKITEGKKELIQWAEIIQEQFKSPIQIEIERQTSTNTQKIVLECQIGVVSNSDRYIAAYELLHDAEIALYRATRKSDTYYNIFTKKPPSKRKQKKLLNRQAPINSQLKSHFIEALKRNKLELSYQPVFTLQKSPLQEAEYFEIEGVEVFDNQQDNYQKLILLTNFSQKIDPVNLTFNVSEFTLESACSLVQELQNQHEAQQSLFLSMECSESFLQQPNILKKIESILTTAQLDKNYLNLDLMLHKSTLKNTDMVASIHQLKQLEVRLNLVCQDIFYKDLREINYLPFDNFILDRSLIEQIVTSYEVLDWNQTILNSSSMGQTSPSFAQSEIAKIINFAHAHNITVTAKDITTQAQLDYLTSVGCDRGQGSFFSPPLDRESLEMFLVWRI